MSLATLPTNGQIAVMPDAATMEKVIAMGDLRGLNAAQRVSWYNARCDAAGLDPRTQPFMYVEFDGKLQLYALKTASDQLIAKHKITIKIADRRYDPDTQLYEVLAQATFPDGQYAEDLGVVAVGGLVGKALANAVMKAVTKAKRRTVLSACGLGMLDESEIEDLSEGYRQASKPAVIYEQAQKAIAEADSQVHGWDATLPDTRPYHQMVADAVKSVNETCSESPIKPLDDRVVHGILALKAVNTDHASGPAPTKVNQAITFMTKVYERDRQWVRKALVTLCRDHEDEATLALKAAQIKPEDISQEPRETGSDDADPDDVDLEGM
jgi:hypothetical protein